LQILDPDEISRTVRYLHREEPLTDVFLIHFLSQVILTSSSTQNDILASTSKCLKKNCVIVMVLTVHFSPTDAHLLKL